MATIVTGAIAAVITARLTRKSEHERWLRDQRMEAYSALLMAATRFRHLMAGGGSNADKIAAFGAVETSYSAVAVLGPEIARAAAEELFRAFSKPEGDLALQAKAQQAFSEVATRALKVD